MGRCSACIVLILALIQTASAEIVVKSGEKIAFLGDSITANGWSNPVGYVRLVMAGLAANGVNAEALPAGKSGHKSNDMLQRVDNEVLSKKPQWMTLSCGVNDVWHGKTGVPLDDEMAAKGIYELKGCGTYKKNLAQIVEKAQAAGVKVVILTSTGISEDLSSPLNQTLAPYNDFLRQFAKEKQLPLADLNGMFRERIKAENKTGTKVLTRDGVHMNFEGDKLMATGILQTFGLDAEQLKKAQDAWGLLAAQADKETKAKWAAINAAKAAAKSPAPAQETTPVKVSPPTP